MGGNDCNTSAQSNGNPSLRSGQAFQGRHHVIYTNGTTGATYFTHVNALGSSTSVTDYAASHVQDSMFYPFGQDWKLGGTLYEERFAKLQRRDAETSLDPTPNRTYCAAYGRWLSPDPLFGDISNPQSLNRYAYVGNNPVTRTDPMGLCGPLVPEYMPARTGGVDPLAEVTVGPVGTAFTSDGDVPIFTTAFLGDLYGPREDEGSGCGSGRPRSQYPKCNPTGDPLVEQKLNIITADYNGALNEATSVVGSVASSAVSAGALATMFVQWSIWESGYNNLEHTAEHNYFGEQQPFQGSVTCPPSDPHIPWNSKNACFPPSMTWGQELANALGATPSGSGVSYLSALESSLPKGTIAQDLQAIANNGWNMSSNYGAKITGGVNIQSLIDCALRNNYMKP